MSDWGPTTAGLGFTRSPPWKLELGAATYRLTIARTEHKGSNTDVQGLTITEGLLWAGVAGSLGALQVELDGIPNDQARQLRRELGLCIARATLQQRVAKFQKAFAKDRFIYEAWVLGWPTSRSSSMSM